MKIFSPHRRKMEASRRFGSREFQNKVKQAQGYKRIFDTRNRGALGKVLHWLHLDSALVLLPALLILGGAFYYLFISDYFLVTSVSVAGAQQVSAEQIQNAFKEAASQRWFLIPRNHSAILSKSSALEMVGDQLPLVKDFAKYKRVWPNRIELEIVERRPGFAFNVSGANYLVDEDGVVVKQVADAGGLPMVYDQVTETVTAGERLNNTKLVVFIMSLVRHWPSKVNSGIKEMRVPGKAASQVQVVSNEGWGVFLDTTRPVEAQLSNLALILSRQIPAKDRLRLAYIDLRFDKWAYYCYKDSPCESQPQANPDAAAEQAAEGESSKVEVE
jgi:cell division septal protein FtsQ